MTSQMTCEDASASHYTGKPLTKLQIPMFLLPILLLTLLANCRFVWPRFVHSSDFAKTRTAALCDSSLRLNMFGQKLKKAKSISPDNDEHHSTPLWRFCDSGAATRVSRLAYLLTEKKDFFDATRLCCHRGFADYEYILNLIVDAR